MAKVPSRRPPPSPEAVAAEILEAVEDGYFPPPNGGIITGSSESGQLTLPNTAVALTAGQAVEVQGRLANPEVDFNTLREAVAEGQRHYDATRPEHIIPTKPVPLPDDDPAITAEPALSETPAAPLLSSADWEAAAPEPYPFQSPEATTREEHQRVLAGTVWREGVLPPGDDGGWEPDPEQGRTSKREVDPLRRFDTSQLYEDMHGLAVHRDYLAHCLRWQWVTRMIEPGMFVLDVGCGLDQQFAKLLAIGVNARVPAMMVQCDLQRITKPFGVKWLVTMDRFNFVTDWPDVLEQLPEPPVDEETGELAFERKYEVISCTEVIEHMHTRDGRRLLWGMAQCLASDGRIYLSTPVFNGKAAANHVHEYTIPELWEVIKSVGLEVEGRYGTFAGLDDLRPVLKDYHRATLEDVREFMGNEVASCFLASCYPDQSRNNIWILRHASAPERATIAAESLADPEGDNAN